MKTRKASFLAGLFAGLLLAAASSSASLRYSPLDRALAALYERCAADYFTAQNWSPTNMAWYYEGEANGLYLAIMLLETGDFPEDN